MVLPCARLDRIPVHTLSPALDDDDLASAAAPPLPAHRHPSATGSKRYGAVQMSTFTCLPVLWRVIPCLPTFCLPVFEVWLLFMLCVSDWITQNIEWHVMNVRLICITMFENKTKPRRTILKFNKEQYFVTFVSFRPEFLVRLSICLPIFVYLCLPLSE